MIRQLGNVWGIALTSATIQNILANRLPVALADVPDKEEIIDAIRHSVFVLNDLPSEVRIVAQEVYYDAVKAAFALSVVMGFVAFIASTFIKSKKLSRS